MDIKDNPWFPIHHSSSLSCNTLFPASQDAAHSSINWPHQTYFLPPLCKCRTLCWVRDVAGVKTGIRLWQGNEDDHRTRDCKGISWRGATELISSHFQWMSVDGTSYQMIVSGCQWMAVDVSGCQWILASFIWDEVKVLLILLSIIYFRWMKMISFQYVCC